MTTAIKFKLQPLSLLRMFWKSRLTFLLVWLAAAAVGAAIVYSLPDMYLAETVIQVESQRIPEKFVASTVNAELQDRLSTLSQGILSYDRLLAIVEKFDLYPKQRKTHAQEEIIAMMRGDITMRLQENWATAKGNSRPSAFRVGYEGPNPTVVALVANQLGTLFIDENLKAREVQAAGTSEFMESQLTEAKRRLEEQEAKLSEYKLKFNGELPEQQSALIATMSQLQIRLQGINEAIERAEQVKTMGEAALASARASESVMAQIAEQVFNPQQSATLPSGQPVKTSERLQRQLEALLTQYTDEWPEVKALRSLIPLVRAEEEKQEKSLKTPAQATGGGASGGSGAPGRGGSDSSASLIIAKRANTAGGLQMTEALMRERERIENLEAQRQIAVKQIQSLNADRKVVVAKTEALQRSLGSLPIREQQLAGVKRDYEISRSNYQSLLDKNLAAEMASEMEKRQKAERFTVIDAARPPEKPVKPNRPVLYALSATLGFLLGVAGALGREWRKNTLLGEWEFPRRTPMLGRIPRIVPVPAISLSSSDPERKVGRAARTRLAIICSLVALLLAALATVAGLYFGRIGL